MGSTASVEENKSSDDVIQKLGELSTSSQQDAALLIKTLVEQVQKLSEQVATLDRAMNNENIQKIIGQSQSEPRTQRRASNASAASDDDATQNAAQAKNCQVMISLNCKSMYEIATALKKYLEINGITVWMCTEMSGGIEFRDAIVDAVDSCTVFLPLINTEWALSAECESEFAYAYRKNLSSKERLPVILPIVFPDLNWNQHKHVRLLLASTNALMWKDDRKAKVYSDALNALKQSGVKPGSTSSRKDDVKSWTEEDVSLFLSDILLRPFNNSGEKFDGMRLLQCSDDAFMEDFGLSALHVRSLKQQLPGSKDNITGVYQCQARTINPYDGNVTESNFFKMFLNSGGIASSGMIWGAGTKHNNYDGVTCVWQGSYCSITMDFMIDAHYSNDTREEYTGIIDLEAGTMNGKYLWFGYGRSTDGKFEAEISRLEDENVSSEILETLEGIVDT